MAPIEVPLSLGTWFNHSPDQVIIQGGDNDITRLDILNQVAWLQTELLDKNIKSCILYTQDTRFFISVFLACACSDVELILPANNSDDFVEMVKADCYMGDWPDKLNSAVLQINTDHVPNKLPNELPQHLGQDYTVVVYTSGSTGEPKRISRKISQLLAEVNTLHATFGSDSQPNNSGEVFAATVSHQHVYGLLFKILWPLLTSRVIWYKVIAFEESLDALLKLNDSVVLVSSPAFLKRIHSQISHLGGLVKVFSSGGVLTDQQQALAESKINASITQVYGSSETGGIAYRGLAQKWQLLGSVEAQIKNNMLWVSSPFCYESGWQCTQDIIKASDDGFELMGRNDRIVKIEEKRVSLGQVEKALRSHRYIADAAVISLEHGRQFLGALLVLNRSDQHQLTALGALKLKQDIKNHLSSQLDAVAIPRKIAFTTESLENAQGKRVVAEISAKINAHGKDQEN